MSHKSLLSTEDFKFVIKDKVDELYEILVKAKKTEVIGRGVYSYIINGYIQHLIESLSELKLENDKMLHRKQENEESCEVKINVDNNEVFSFVVGNSTFEMLKGGKK